jgi:hypothetical protein
MKNLQTLHISNPLSSLSLLSLLSFFSSQLLSFPGFNSFVCCSASNIPLAKPLSFPSTHQFADDWQWKTSALSPSC